MDGLFSLTELDDLETERLPGTRLRRLEVYNWGTFHSRVWSFEVAGRNALLTGDIGSGKSTFVDALTTLLLPSHRITYNKAAGAETRERDLRSYVLGFYRSERNEVTGSSRPVPLRDARSYSVILGVFGNSDFDNTVTLAQVFWTREGRHGQPERFYVVADGDLSIADHFAGFGTDIAALRRRLQTAGIKLHTSFPDYGKDFRRRLGIESEQAMELFGQTVSMKAVDNLNDFVRHHMLEPFDVRAQLDALVTHFDDLTRAHDAVVRAKAQLDMLAPLVSELATHRALNDKVAQLSAQRLALPCYLARRKQDLLTEQLAAVERRLADEAANQHQVEAELNARRGLESQLTVQIAGQGGDRIAALEDEIRRLELEKDRRLQRFGRFNELLATAGLAQLSAVEAYPGARQRAHDVRTELSTADTQVQNDTTERRVLLRQTQDASKLLDLELSSLQSRTSNLDDEPVRLRQRIASELGIDTERLPFAAELIQVRSDAVAWEGAAERVLRSFALAVLVPNEHYEHVSRWIDDHHLGARLVYFRVPERIAPRPELPRRAGQLLLLDCVEVKAHTLFEPWLIGELERRANHVCVDSTSEFRQLTRAVTRAGQIKDKERHEKDDRRRIDDRRSYVLGWNNQQKIDALLEEKHLVQTRLNSLVDEVTELGRQAGVLAERLRALNALEEYRNQIDLDWQQTVRDIRERTDQVVAIERSSDVLATLTAERDSIRSEIASLEGRLRELQRDRGRLEAERQTAKGRLAEVRQLLNSEQTTLRDEPWLGAIGARLKDGLDGLNPVQLDRVEAQLVADWTSRIEQQTTRQHNCAQRITKQMAEFRAAYPAETAELDNSVESGPEYVQLHDRIAGDDLPRFEREFKESLNQNTVRDIAAFFAQLNKQEKLIIERVERINDSLTSIDYNPERYIRLVPDQSPSMEIREFISDLRACTDNVVGDASEQYSEQKFLQVKKIVDRFRGREKFTEIDRQWTRRVTDVRNWFVFSASERWRADDSEYENYTDSTGKSGGQKEKLAYTILAASLAYQFRLDWGAARSRSFRLVAIDEAFGRGSEESTRFALRLFTRLGLQLLVVTPLQKIHVIEPYVSAVGYVDNVSGDFSRLQGLTVGECRERRANRTAALRVAE